MILQSFSNATLFQANQDFGENQVGFYIATAGNLTVVFADNNVITFTALAAGTILPVRCRRATSAPASTLVLYE